MLISPVCYVVSTFDNENLHAMYKILNSLLFNKRAYKKGVEM